MQSLKQKIKLIHIAILGFAVVLISGIFLTYSSFGGTTLGVTLDTEPDLTKGLVGHWTFDGPDMTSNVADSSGQGNNGKLFGTFKTATTSVPGRLGQALEFNGSDDYVLTSGQATYDFERTDSFTISMWVKITDDGANNFLISKTKDDANLDGFAVFTSNSRSDTVNFELRGDAAGILRSVIYGTTDVVDGNWHHIVTVKGTGTGAPSEMSIYVDGVKESPTTFDDDLGSNTILNNTNVSLAGRPTATPVYTNGTLDDVRIYNRALSGAEIKSLYDLGATTHVGTTIDTEPALERGLVGHWTFDGPDMYSNVADRSGQGNNGNLVGTFSTATTSVSGRLGQALDFNGSDDYVNLGDNANLELTFPLSVGAWVKPGTLASGDETQTIISKYDGRSSQREWAFYFDAGTDKNAFLISDTGAGGGNVEVALSDTVLPSADLGKWTHVYFTADSSRNYTFYLNGVPDGTGTFTLTSIKTGGAEAHIGALAYSGTGPTAFFGGTIDDIRIFGRELGASEVKSLYDLGATTHIGTTLNTEPDLQRSLVGHWTFDGPDMYNNVADVSGQGNNGKLAGTFSTATTSVIGKLGQALEFNGSDDYVSIDGLTTQLSNDTAGTVTLWVKTSDIGTEHLPFSISRDADSTQTEFFVDIHADVNTTPNPDNDDNIAVVLAVDGTRQWEAITGVNSLDSLYGSWFHIAVVQDGTEPKIYLNGIEDTTFRVSTDKTGWFKAILTDATSDSDTANLGVLERNGSDIVPFKNSLDDVRIYNRALSLSEISKLYDLGR